MSPNAFICPRWKQTALLNDFQSRKNRIHDSLQVFLQMRIMFTYHTSFTLFHLIDYDVCHHCHRSYIGHHHIISSVWRNFGEFLGILIKDTNIVNCTSERQNGTIIILYLFCIWPFLYLIFQWERIAVAIVAQYNRISLFHYWSRPQYIWFELDMKTLQTNYGLYWLCSNSWKYSRV